MTLERVTIAKRYSGPDESGNGGYSAGLLAQALGTHAPVEVRLKAPPPLDRTLHIERDVRRERSLVLSLA